MNIITEMHREMGFYAFQTGQPRNENESWAWLKGWDDAYHISDMDGQTGKPKEEVEEREVQP